MGLLSAKFKLISVILDTTDIWSVTADIIDNRGLYYANDVKLGDVVFSSNSSLKYTVTEIISTAGARLICKLTWLGTESPKTPVIGDDAVIGTVYNGVVVIPDAAAQGVSTTFIETIKTVPNTTLSLDTSDDQYATTKFVNLVTRYVHTQVTPSITWVINHNMFKQPICTIIDSANDQIVGEIEYTTINTVTITFSGAVSGKAYLT